jgi:hypothetical protein
MLTAFSVLFLPILPIFPVFPVLHAQTRAAGRVVTADSSPVPGARVVLHRVGPEAQGPIDSALSDRQGRFRFAFRPDTSAFYLVSARHAGIEYFSPPVPTNPERPDTGVRIIVYDTSSTVLIRLEARNLVVTRPGEDGSRGVLDLMVLRNEGQQTRIAGDSARPSWSAPLPRGTVGLDLAEGDVSRDAVGRRGDSVVVIAPFAPGEKQLTLQYLIPGNQRAVDLPLDQPGVMVNVMAEEKGVRVSGEGITPADSQTLQGRSFRRWTGRTPTAGVLRIELPVARQTPEWLLAGLVTLLALALGAAGWRSLARRPAAVPGSADPEQLLDALAALDARYAGRDAATAPEEWASYQTERARLKAALEASLAARRWTQ